MNNPKIHNALFAIIVSLVLSATAWSLSERGGSTMPLEIRMPEPPADSQPEIRGTTERMIEQGTLSKEQARFWSKETP